MTDMTNDELRQIEAGADAAVGGAKYAAEVCNSVHALVAEVRRLRQERDEYRSIIGEAARKTAETLQQ